MVVPKLVQVTVTCIQEWPVGIFRLTAYSKKTSKILDTVFYHPGIDLHRTSDCFVYWCDPRRGIIWGLNFVAPIDASRFISILVRVAISWSSQFVVTQFGKVCRWPPVVVLSGLPEAGRPAGGIAAVMVDRRLPTIEFRRLPLPPSCHSSSAVAPHTDGPGRPPSGLLSSIHPSDRLRTRFNPSHHLSSFLVHRTEFDFASIGHRPAKSLRPLRQLPTARSGATEAWFLRQRHRSLRYSLTTKLASDTLLRLEPSSKPFFYSKQLSSAAGVECAIWMMAI
ncbi:unnamed protein product [Soboliphyme baturini]|uniref:WH1 domain-containing protein n=1 Tax=Soboliphyme baturini TaxID=241478 RepID=A0A183ID91_9BILA|nr:unnamed protein product [Soboliphyme baturini]